MNGSDEIIPKHHNGTSNENCKIYRTNIEIVPRESDAVWEQLLRLAEDGDIRAIKLYYEMLEKKQQAQTVTGGTDKKAESEIESMAAIRRAVFGDAAVDAAAARAMTHRDRGAAVPEDGLDGDDV